MGTKSSALSRLFPHIELIGAQRLPDGIMRGGLIRIADLGHLALVGAKAKDDLFPEWSRPTEQEEHKSYQ